MSNFDWNAYAVGGAARPDSFSGMDPQFSSALAQLFSAAPDEIRQSLRVSSGYRSPERQQELWQGALQKYGSPDAARKWVAPPGKSQHNHGHAADLKYLSPTALKWAHENAGNYGLAFPLSNENWHVELAGARGGKAAPAQPVQTALGDAVAPPPSGPAQPQMSPLMEQAPQGPAGQNFGQLAMAFMQNTAASQRQREEEAAAEQQRRAALFGGGGVASLYG